MHKENLQPIRIEFAKAPTSRNVFVNHRSPRDPPFSSFLVVDAAVHVSPSEKACEGHPYDGIRVLQPKEALKSSASDKKKFVPRSCTRGTGRREAGAGRGKTGIVSLSRARCACAERRS